MLHSLTGNSALKIEKGTLQSLFCFYCSIIITSLLPPVTGEVMSIMQHEKNVENGKGDDGD
jgi:hypothetical protein